MDVQAIRIDKTGPPEVMRLERVALKEPEEGEIQVRVCASGVNFIDTYHRSGLYPMEPPCGIGLEGAGEVMKAGKGASFREGDKVVMARGPLGMYAEAVTIPSDSAMPLPESLSYEQAAALALKGLTVQYLYRSSYVLKAGDVFVFHAAAGGVGLLACQWARAIGAVMIGVVGNEEKAALARAHGCAYTVDRSKEDFVERVKEIAPGGVGVVYDSVGKATFEKSLACLRPRGTLVTFGNSSGEAEPFEPSLLARMGSLFVTRPTLFHYMLTAEERETRWADVMNHVIGGAISLPSPMERKLADAVAVHKDLEAGATTGSTVLIP